MKPPRKADRNVTSCWTQTYQMGAILNHWERLRNEVLIAKGLLGICPLSAFLFEGETDLNVFSISQIISPILPYDFPKIHNL